MEDVGIFYDHLAYFTAIWYSLVYFIVGIIWYNFPILGSCTKRNLATLNKVIIKLFE
jgi:hypothetical protein